MRCAVLSVEMIFCIGNLTMGILYNASNLNVYTLNATAAYIWNCCDGESNVKRIAEDMSQFCQIDLDVALEHVKSTIRQFHDSGLLVSMTRNHET